MLRKATLIFLFFMLFFQQICCAEKVWQAASSGIGDLDVRSISVFAENDKFVCAACEKSVYFSQDGGESWKEAFSLETEAGWINFVTFHCSNPNILYSATSKGLFATEDHGRSWRRIFRKVSEAENNVRWITLDCLDNDRIYIGTDSSLYISQDKGATWRKSNGGLTRSAVRSLAVHPFNSEVLYLANSYGLFKSIDAGRLWERIYITSEKLIDSEDEQNSSETGASKSLINSIAIVRNEPRRIFIGTGAGVFISPDAGRSWNKLPSQGLSSENVNFIVVSDKEDVICAATEKGVFEFLPHSKLQTVIATKNLERGKPGLNRWQEIYQGMTARNVRGLALNMEDEQLFAATDRGVFKTVDVKSARKEKMEEKVEEVEEIAQNSEMDFERAFKELALNEPSIQQVQEAALRYAEVVHPDNIKTLRRNARLKAFLPDVSLDYDKTIYGSSTTKVGFVGPRDWGLSFSWDVGDLIFSEQVRLINSNTRLLVQLRDDILNEVTRFYYERRKLQTELMLAPPETLEDKLNQALRLQELTANIDALTGNYFSLNLKLKKEKK